MQNTFILEMEQARAISIKFSPTGYMQKLLANFSQNYFAPTFGGYLEFLRKCKNAFILKMERDRVILTKSLTQRVFAESTGDFSINWFPATFGSHLEFLSKMEIHIDLRNSKVERFRPKRYQQGLLGTFCKNCIVHIWRPDGVS